jgi:hypothetical protein
MGKYDLVAPDGKGDFRIMCPTYYVSWISKAKGAKFNHVAYHLAAETVRVIVRDVKRSGGVVLMVMEETVAKREIDVSSRFGVKRVKL